MSDTPRTKAATQYATIWHQGHRTERAVVPATDAEALERELSAAQARVGELEAQLAAQLADEQALHRASNTLRAYLKQQLTAARQDNERLTIERDASIKLNLEINEEMQRLDQANGALEKDARRLDWLEAQYGLHNTVEILYVVVGYDLQVIEADGELTTVDVHGETLRAAIDAALSAAKEGENV